VWVWASMAAKSKWLSHFEFAQEKEGMFAILLPSVKQCFENATSRAGGSGLAEMLGEWPRIDPSRVGRRFGLVCPGLKDCCPKLSRQARSFAAAQTGLIAG
jgi:hypothetical protein